MSCSVTLGVLKANRRHWTLSSGITCSSTSFRGSPRAVECFAVEGMASSSTDPLSVMSWKRHMSSEMSQYNQYEDPLREVEVTVDQLSQWGRKDGGSDLRYFMYEKRAQYFQEDPGKSNGTHHQAFWGHVLKYQRVHVSLKSSGRPRSPYSYTMSLTQIPKLRRYPRD